jgi:hypothetical protein
VFLDFTRFARGSLVVLLTVRLGCLCAHSLPPGSIVCSKYDPNRLAAQATLATNLGTAMRTDCGDVAFALVRLTFVGLGG